MQRYRSGYNGPDSKFLEAPAVSSAENVRRTGLCVCSDFTISYRSCVFFLHSSGAGITLEVYGELSERSKVRHSKCRVPKRNLGFESLTLRHVKTHFCLPRQRCVFVVFEEKCTKTSEEWASEQLQHCPEARSFPLDSSKKCPF